MKASQNAHLLWQLTVDSGRVLPTAICIVAKKAITVKAGKDVALLCRLVLKSRETP